MLPRSVEAHDVRDIGRDLTRKAARHDRHTDHWWNREHFDGDDRKVGRLVSMQGLSVETGLSKGVLKRVTAKYEDAWRERGSHGELNDPDILRRIWLHRGIPDQEWIRIWEVEEVHRWMNESKEYQELRARHGESDAS